MSNMYGDDDVVVDFFTTDSPITRSCKLCAACQRCASASLVRSGMSNLLYWQCDSCSGNARTFRGAAYQDKSILERLGVDFTALPIGPRLYPNSNHRQPSESIKEQTEADLVLEAIQLLAPDFEIETEVRGVHTATGIGVRADLVLTPKHHVIEAGFPDAIVPVEVKKFSLDKHGKISTPIAAAYAQAISYGQSTFGGREPLCALLYAGSLPSYEEFHYMILAQLPLAARYGCGLLMNRPTETGYAFRSAPVTTFWSSGMWQGYRFHPLWLPPKQVIGRSRRIRSKL